MTTSELAHYGVPGMKWGVRKRRANERIAKYGNTKTKANIVEGGKIAASLVLSNIGVLAIHNIPMPGAVRTGMTMLASGANLAVIISSIVNIVDNSRTDRKGGPSLDVKKD